MISSEEAKLIVAKSRRRKFIVTWTKKGLVMIMLAILCVGMAVPALWMFSTSLKANSQVFHDPPIWIPHPVVWSNYIKAWTYIPFARLTMNTVLYTLSVVIGVVLSNSLAAYGFARLRFPGRDFLFGLMLATMMLPGMVTMIPNYVLFAKLHWVGTYLPLVVPAYFAGPFNTFLLRQFFLGIPQELSEAARIDGANDLYIWARILMPLSKPALATVAIFTFDGTWNDYVGPIIYLNNEKLYTLQVGLAMFRSVTEISWQYLMAASLLVMLPVIILFFTFQRYFIEGSAINGSLKG